MCSQLLKNSSKLKLTTQPSVITWDRCVNYSTKESMKPWYNVLEITVAGYNVSHAITYYREITLENLGFMQGERPVGNNRIYDVKGSVELLCFDLNKTATLCVLGYMSGAFVDKTYPVKLCKMFPSSEGCFFNIQNSLVIKDPNQRL